jgi:hypothetical protein
MNRALKRIEEKEIFRTTSKFNIGGQASDSATQENDAQTRFEDSFD